MGNAIFSWAAPRFFVEDEGRVKRLVRRPAAFVVWLLLGFALYLIGQIYVRWAAGASVNESLLWCLVGLVALGSPAFIARPVLSWSDQDVTLRRGLWRRSYPRADFRFVYEAPVMSASGASGAGGNLIAVHQRGWRRTLGRLGDGWNLERVQATLAPSPVSAVAARSLVPASSAD